MVRCSRSAGLETAAAVCVAQLVRSFTATAIVRSDQLGLNSIAFNANEHFTKKNINLTSKSRSDPLDPTCRK